MKLLLSLLIAIAPVIVQAQFVNHLPEETEETSIVDIGVGLGVDYGGIGGQIRVYPDKHLALFGGVGYAFAGAGYNFGFKGRVNPDDHFCFTVGAMYGYNAAIKITDQGGGTYFKKIYTGPSFSIGGDIRSRRKEKNFTTIQLIIPIRPGSLDKDLQNLRANNVMVNDPWPVTLSVAYHWGF